MTGRPDGRSLLESCGLWLAPCLLGAREHLPPPAKSQDAEDTSSLKAVVSSQGLWSGGLFSRFLHPEAVTERCVPGHLSWQGRRQEAGLPLGRAPCAAGPDLAVGSSLVRLQALFVTVRAEVVSSPSNSL